jgi:O-antigen/teichoic acid export membrane protein
VEDERHEIRRGLLFLGSAGAFARVVDLAAIVLVLFFVTKEELGAATVAWALTTIAEAAVGIGLGTAIVQTPSLEARLERASVTFALLSGLALAILLGSLAPFVASWTGDPNVTAYMLVSSAKLVLTGISVVPLHLLTRSLRFRAFGAVQVFATLLAAITRVVAAMGGLGAWAIVLGHTLHPLYILLALPLVKARLPRLTRDLRGLGPLLRFGMRSSSSEVIERVHRHADTLLVNHFLGPGAVGLYKVAMDVTGGVATAIGDIVNKATLPVLSRLAEERDRFGEALLWATKKVVSLAAPILLTVAILGGPLIAMIQGGEFERASALLPFLAIAAFLRLVFQLFPMAFFARGFPEESLRLSFVSIVVLFVVLGGSLAVLGPSIGLYAAGVGWLLHYPALAPFSYRALRRTTGLRFRDHLRLRSPRHPVTVDARTESETRLRGT